MIEIGFLGTGGWIATKERDNTSFLIRHENKLILVDCPGGAVQKIKLLGYEPEDTVSLFVTHVHPDHIYGLPSLVHSLMLEELAIGLYGSEHSLDFCRRLLDLFQLRESRIKCRIDFNPLVSGQSFLPLSDVSCSCLHVPHHPSSLAYSFHFGREEKTLIYSGDTPLYSPLFDEAKESDLLIHECSAPKWYFDRYPALYDIHTAALDLGRESQSNRIKKLIPCHIFGDMGFAATDLEREILESFEGDVVMPYDLMTLKL